MIISKLICIMGATNKKDTKRRAKRNFRSHATGLRRTLRARHPTVRLSAESIEFLESAIRISTAWLTRESAQYMRSAGRETISASDVALAWKMSVPESVRANMTPAH